MAQKLAICRFRKCNNYVKTYREKCCSIECNKKYYWDQVAIAKPILVCNNTVCAITFTQKYKGQKYCSSSCSNFTNNLGNRKHGLAPSRCKACGGKCRNYKSIYCSITCRQTDEIRLWLDGKLDGATKYGHAKYVRRYLSERSKEICEMPGCNESRRRKNGSSILQVDHIDGNWRNNTVDNLRLICPSCHALTENWGAANMGKGRKWKQVYSQF